MDNNEIWDVEAASNYDTPGAGMFSPDVLGPTVDRLAELAGAGRALEFAIGTGRVAVPLSERCSGSGDRVVACDGWPTADEGR